MIAAGTAVPDVRVWRTTTETVRLPELAGPNGALFLFYLFDWSST